MTIRELIAPALLMQETARQRSAVRATSKRYGLPVMPANLLSQTKETKCAETLFVLGSVESVLGLDDDDRAHVSQHVYIGIGAWTVHPFVPDFLALEHINPNPELGLASESETLVERSYRQALEGWHLRDDVGKVGAQILFFSPPCNSITNPARSARRFWGQKQLGVGQSGCQLAHAQRLADGDAAVF